MKRTTTPELDLSVMLEAIRQKHIDINTIIKEELNEVLPQYIDNIIQNVYDGVGANNE